MSTSRPSTDDESLARTGLNLGTSLESFFIHDTVHQLKRDPGMAGIDVLIDGDTPLVRAMSSIVTLSTPQRSQHVFTASRIRTSVSATARAAGASDMA